MAFYLYMLKCSDHSYYVGHTDNLEKRVSEHQSGQLGGYPSSRLPVTLVYSETFASRIEALEMECRIKGWTRAKKEALIGGDWCGLSKLAKKRFDR